MNFHVKFTNKWLYTLTLIAIIFTLAVAVFAYEYIGKAPLNGHAGDKVLVFIPAAKVGTNTGEMNLQDAITNGYFTIPICSNGQIIKWLSNRWTCAPDDTGAASLPTCTNGQILKWQGTAFVCAADEVGGVAPDQAGWLYVNNKNRLGKEAGDDRAAIIFGARDTINSWYLGAVTNADSSGTSLGVYSWLNQKMIQVWKADGSVGIGVDSPSKALEVAGDVKGTRLCIGTDCRDAWPTGGTSGGSAGSGGSLLRANIPYNEQYTVPANTCKQAIRVEMQTDAFREATTPYGDDFKTYAITVNSASGAQQTLSFGSRANSGAPNDFNFLGYRANGLSKVFYITNVGVNNVLVGSFSGSNLVSFTNAVYHVSCLDGGTPAVASASSGVRVTTCNPSISLPRKNPPAGWTCGSIAESSCDNGAPTTGCKGALMESDLQPGIYNRVMLHNPGETNGCGTSSPTGSLAFFQNINAASNTVTYKVMFVCPS